MLKFSDIKNELFSALLCLTIIFNYIIMFIRYNDFTGKVFVTIYFLILFIFLIKNPKDNLWPKFIIFCLALIAAGTPLTAEHWDAWAIWLFNAKRIYTDANFFIYHNNYTDLGVGYPLIMPTFGAAFAQFLGNWNLIFPKISIFLMFLPIFIYSIDIFNKLFLKIFFIFNIFILNKFLFNGYVDGLVAIYFSFSVFLSYEIFINKKDNTLNILNCFSFLVILSNLKNEGFVLSIILISFIIIFELLKSTRIIIYKIRNIIFFSPIIYLIWKIHTIGFVNENMILYGANFERFSSFKVFIYNLSIILKSLMLNNFFLLSITLFLTTFFYLKNKFLFIFVTYCSIVYFLILCVVYLTTPLDINWQLITSGSRTMLAINYLLCFSSILTLSTKININKIKN